MSYADDLINELLGDEETPAPKPKSKPKANKAEEPVVVLPKPIKFAPPPEKKPKKEKRVFVAIQAGWKIVQPYDSSAKGSPEDFGYVVKKIPQNRRIHCGFCKRLMEAGEPALFYDSKLEKEQYWWCQPTCGKAAKGIVST